MFLKLMGNATPHKRVDVQRKNPDSVGHPLPDQMIAQGFSELMNTLDVHMSVR